MPRHIGLAIPHPYPTEWELESRRNLRRFGKDQTKLFKSLLDSHRFLPPFLRAGLGDSVSERDRVKARSASPILRLGIGMAVPGQPIGPWSQRTGTPMASTTGRDQATSGRLGPRSLHMAVGTHAVGSGHQRCIVRAHPAAILRRQRRAQSPRLWWRKVTSRLQ